MIYLYRIDLAAAAKEIGIDMLVSHDTSQDGSDVATDAFLDKIFSTL
jgi:hypothetical protein